MNRTLALPTIISLAGIWYLIAIAYREYRVDRFRDNLFRLRDELFYLGLHGMVPFENSAYGALRTMINGNLRFGDSLSFSLMFFLRILAPSRTVQELLPSHQQAWLKGLARLDEDAQRQLIRVRERMHRMVAAQVVLGSPLVLLFAVPVATLLLVGLIATTVYGSLKPRIARLLFDPADSAAYSEGCLA